MKPPSYSCGGISIKPSPLGYYYGIYASNTRRRVFSYTTRFKGPIRMDKTEAAREFIRVYGDRGYYILRAILDCTKTLIGKARLGDFDFKSVRRKLSEYGLDYNPSLLLSKLEREYGLIETTYKSSSQHWWRVTDLDAIEDAVAEYEGRPPPRASLMEPRARLLRIQFYSLDPERMLEVLKSASRRRRAPKELIRRIVFHDLIKVVEFLEAAREYYPEELAPEIELAERILEAAEEAVIALRGGDYSLRNRGSEFYYDTLRGRLREPL